MTAVTIRYGRLALLFATLASFCAISPAYAARIDSATMFGLNAGTGPGVGLVAVPIINTTLVNNDNELGPGANNIDVVVKRFDANGVIDIEFNTTPTAVPGNPNNTTEYLVFEGVDNNTGTPWVNYTMQLGFGVGGSFTPSLAGDGLDFDFPTFDSPPTSTAFGGVVPGEDVLTFGGGLHAAGLQTYRVRIDVSDGFSSFTLRQIPVPIPEPATLALAGVAMIGVLGVRRRS